MAFRIKFHSSARNDLNASSEWYFERSPDAAIRFARAVQQAVDATRERPLAPAQNQYRERRRAVPGFPYSLIYQVDEELIVLLAIQHNRRADGYWRSTT